MGSTTARSPRQVTCDSATAGRLARAGTLALSPGRWVALLVLVGLLGFTYAQLYHWVVGVVTGGLMMCAALCVRYIQLRKAIRRIAHAGAVMSTAYDDQERFVITSSAGATGLGRGSVLAWKRSGDVVVLRVRATPLRILLPAELVDQDDLAFLTDRSGDLVTSTTSQAPTSAPSTTTPVPDGEPTSSAPTLPFNLTVSADDHVAMTRAAVRLWLTRRQTWLVLGLDGLGLVAGLLLRSWLLVVVAALAAALCARAPWTLRRAIRRAYPIGSEVRAGFTDDAFLLETVVSTEKVRLSRVVRVVAGRDGTVIELSDRRQAVLPARLLPAEAVAQLASTTRP